MIDSSSKAVPAGIKFVDLFAGCGGLSHGLLASGFVPSLAVENAPSAVASYTRNFPAATVLGLPIQEALRLLLKGQISSNAVSDVELVCGGPPCQGFSEFNRFRSTDDVRNELISYFLEFAFQLNPKVILIENVPGLLSIDGGRTPRALLAALSANGYEGSLFVLQAGGYGVPQSRWRLFLVGVRGGARAFLPPRPTHRFPRMPLWGATGWREAVIHPPLDTDLLSSAQSTVTVRDAIGDLPALQNGEILDQARYRHAAHGDFQRYARSAALPQVTAHATKRLGALQLERVRNVPHRPMAGWWDLPDHLKPQNLLRHGDKRYENRFGRLWWDGIFNTILTDAHLYWSRVIHPEQDRVISVRESARAQSLPDHFQFSGRMTEQYRQIGNAVPPLVAAALGRAIRDVV